MAAAPGRSQSRGSTFQLSGCMPCSAESVATSADQLPPGARNHSTEVPSAAADSVLWAPTTSSAIRAGSRSGSCSSWVREWSHRRIPASTTCLTSASWPAAFLLTMQNVATAPWRCRISRILGVQRGSGPSSKVSAMVWLSASLLRSAARGTTGAGATSWTWTGGGSGAASGASSGAVIGTSGISSGGSSGTTRPKTSTAR